VDLTLPINREVLTTEYTENTEKKTKEFEVFFVDGSYDTPALCACFDKDINEDLVKQIAKREPLRAVFRDAGYGSDSTKINIKQIFKLVSPHTEVKAI
jgi:adenine-specific DNA-methyltransferase